MRRVTWRRLPLIFCLMLVVQPLLAPAMAQQPSTLDPSNMDFSVDPADDFYQFANGGWLERTEIPSYAGSYGVFDELRDLTSDQLFSVMEMAGSSDTLEEGSDEWKALALYEQGNDIEARNAKGLEPIQPILGEIQEIETVDGLHTYHQTALFDLVAGLFTVVVDVDLLDSTTYVPYLDGPYLGLPTRDYYVEEDPGIRDAYIEVSAALLVHAGYDEAEAQEAATAVYAFEKTLAGATLTREDQQDFSLTYNPMSVGELRTAYPLMDWGAYLSALGLSGVETLIVSDRGFIEALPGIVEETPVEVIRDYYTLEVMWTFSDVLSEEIDATAFSFEGPVLDGVTEQRPHEERTLEQLDASMPDALGRLYVEEYFPPEAKAEITALVDAEIAAFRMRIENNDWMTEETRQLALEKLDGISVKVGYPDTWRTYEEVTIADSYAMTMLSAAHVGIRDNLGRAGQDVDRDEWMIPAQMVNAFYNPTMNEIVFPAAILQAPFFQYGGDPAANFGGIGMVIGHELTHGFDLSGSQFDTQGNLVNWWAEEDYARFQELNQQVVDHYDAIEVLPGVNINGQITVGENVADMGGTQIAFDALMIYLSEQGDPATTPSATPVAMATPVGTPQLEDFTAQQRFFISVASVWRAEIRDEALRTQVMVDVHSPASVRAVVPIQHMDAFYDAFDIQPGDPMYLPPEERIVIW